jgi:O-antigen/teichoic acid export membrane protein
MLIASVIAAITNVVLNYIFIKLFGYVAAGYTTLACYIIYSLGHFIISRNLINSHSPGTADEIFNKGIILILSLITIILGIGSNFLFGYVVIRYAIVAIGIVSMLFFRNRIQGMLGQFMNNNK